MNRRNNVIGYFLHSIGGLSGTIMDAKQIIAASIKSNSHAIIICHNHPSGALTPSTVDIEVTKKIVGGASFLDLIVLDHIILTESSFYSFADEGTLPYVKNEEFKLIKKYIDNKSKT